MNKLFLCIVMLTSQPLWAHYNSFTAEGYAGEPGAGSSCERTMERADLELKQNAQAKCAMYQAVQVTKSSYKMDCDPYWAKVNSRAEFICSTENNIYVTGKSAWSENHGEAIKEAYKNAVRQCKGFDKDLSASEIGYGWEFKEFNKNVRTQATFYCYK